LLARREARVAERHAELEMLDFDLDLRRLQPERGSTLHEHGAGRAVAAEFILLAFEREQRTFADIQELEIDEVSEKQAAFPGNREGVSGARGACAVRQSVTIDEGRLVLLPKLQVVRSFAEIDRADEIERVGCRFRARCDPPENSSLSSASMIRRWSRLGFDGALPGPLPRRVRSGLQC
jgi:hypothetical protein